MQSPADKYHLTSLPRPKWRLCRRHPVVYDLATTGEKWEELTFGMTIIYGQLNIMIHDDGGVTPYCAINTMTVRTA